jgi:hypothetical protein
MLRARMGIRAHPTLRVRPRRAIMAHCFAVALGRPFVHLHLADLGGEAVEASEI